MALPLREGESFSLLACHQGLQFFPDKATAVGQMRRALAPDGRLAIACWRSLQDIPAALELNEIAERHVGPIVDSRHSFGNAAELRAVLTDTGFRDCRVEAFAHDVRFADGTLFATLNAMAVIGMTEKGKKLNEGERGELAAKIATESRTVIARYTKHGEFVIPLSTNIATARA